MVFVRLWPQNSDRPYPPDTSQSSSKKTSVVYGSPYLKLAMKLNYRFLLQLDIWVSGSKASMTIGNPSWVPLVSRIGAKKAYQMLSIFRGTPPSQNTTQNPPKLYGKCQNKGFWCARPRGFHFWWSQTSISHDFGSKMRFCLSVTNPTNEKWTFSPPWHPLTPHNTPKTLSQHL